MTAGQRTAPRIIIEPCEIPVSPEAAAVIFSEHTSPAILESSLRNSPYARFSILAARPADEFIHPAGAQGCPFDSFAEHVAKYPPATTSDIEPPGCGWIGYFTYESGLSIEGIRCTTRSDVDLPAAWFRLYDAAAVFDHHTRQWLLTAVDWPGRLAARRPPVAARLNDLRETLNCAATSRLPDLPPIDPTRTASANMTRREYYARLARVKRYIEAGDIYQANLTQRFTVRTDATPVELYRRLRRACPSSHAAFLPWGAAAIISASPELFLELRDGHVVTRPIKGTRPRTDEPDEDRRSRADLMSCEKERAELTMITDLLRNDLGRVCSYGSVRVTAAGDLEEHPTVFHRVATIVGDLRPGKNWLDLLRASFPGGSITGAPKIRAMQIIDELEPTQRGVYCGSIGRLGLDGSMSLNIAIRTMTQTGHLVHVHAGGAIVADSVAEREYEETLAKASGMFRALGVDLNARKPTPKKAAIP